MGARNFAAFWIFWNPIFGYYLGTKVFKPLKSASPQTIALMLTFVFCGMIHDLVTTAIRGKLSVFFSVWFLLMGAAVSITKFIDYNLSRMQWLFRAAANLLIISLCLLCTIQLNNRFIVA